MLNVIGIVSVDKSTFCFWTLIVQSLVVSNNRQCSIETSVESPCIVVTMLWSWNISFNYPDSQSFWEHYQRANFSLYWPWGWSPSHLSSFTSEIETGPTCDMICKSWRIQNLQCCAPGFNFKYSCLPCPDTQLTRGDMLTLYYSTTCL